MLLICREGLEQTGLLPAKVGTGLGLERGASFEGEVKGRHSKKEEWHEPRARGWGLTGLPRWHRGSLNGSNRRRGWPHTEARTWKVLNAQLEDRGSSRVSG